LQTVTAPMKRLLVLALLCFGTSAAHAQASTLPDGSTLSFTLLYLHEGNSPTLVQPKQLPNSLWNYFNFAHCFCSQAGASMNPSFVEKTFAYLIQFTSPPQNASQLQPLVGQVWVGNSCNADVMTRNLQCHQVMSATIPSIGGIQATNGVKPEISVQELMEPETACPGMGFCLKPCDQRVLAANEWVGVDTMNSGTPDYWVNQEIDTDSQPPPTPTTITATGSENGINLTWTTPAGNISDIAFYQALCTDPAGNPPSTNPPAPRYSTPRTLCGAAFDAHTVLCNFDDPGNPDTCTAPSTTTGSTDGGVPDAGIPVDAAPDAAVVGPTPDAGPEINQAAIAQLPPAFICGEVDDATATSMQISGLQNNVDYTVMLLAIDKYGNAAAVVMNKVLTPKPVTDFWQDLHDNGSQVQGGFCLIAETYGDDNPLTNALRGFRDHTLADTVLGRAAITAYYGSLAKLGAVVHGHWTLRILSGIVLAPLVIFALLWHYLTLPGLLIIVLGLVLHRRMVKSRMLAKVVAASALGCVMIGAPARAHAQSPYWENQATGSTDENLGFGEELGPPKWHVGIKLGPYTPAIDSQSTFRNSAGQGPYAAMFGGYTLMPMLDVDRFLWSGWGQLGVGISIGYMGKSANAFVIPSDPSDPNRPRSPGDTTAFRMIPLQVTAIYRLSILDDDYGIPIVPYVRGGLGYYVWWSTIDGHLSTDSMVSGSAIGATVGLVGTFGISIRAERIDAAAARSMRESGIAHAGFYAEVNAGWVDGFGKSTKLDVGATTWFAGAELEF
jgi:hypothetical protein